jgi:hypothetical protein
MLPNPFSVKINLLLFSVEIFPKYLKLVKVGKQFCPKRRKNSPNLVTLVGSPSFHVSSDDSFFLASRPLRKTISCKTDSDTPVQGCQTVHFQTKYPNSGKFLWDLDWEMLIYFMAICNSLKK